jgi:dolichyl-phosphate-mannose-protein mannosyltransferase
MNLGLQINKKDAVTIILLSIVFFSIAVVNLGLTQSPTTTAQLTAGQSFYVDLGNSTNVKSMVFLLKEGAFNVTISSGSPGNWQAAASNVEWPYGNSAWSEDYYKWHEVSVDQTTQYLKVDVGPAGYQTLIAEIAVIDQNNQQVKIQSITNTGDGNPDLHNLVDEQNKVQYPSDYMQNTYFDEIYFVRTAEQYLHSQLPYEWTHPPLGKLIQASSILIFGFDPFGWRIMGVLFATLMIAVMYLLGKKLFGTWIGGFSAAFLLTFDFMHFTMARMGTADTYVVFFSLASQLFFLIYLKNVLDKGWKASSILPLFLAIFFFSLGFSTKWLVLFGFLGQLVLLAALRLSEVKNLKGNISTKVYAFLEHPYSVIVVFLLMAIGIYFLTYIPDMLAGRSFFDVLNLQGQMYIYQSTLKATHPFASPWYSWPLMFNPFNSATHVPLWLESATLPNGTQSTIVLLGNPALWWFGFAAVVGLTIFYVPKLFRKNFSLKKNLPAIFIITFFFFQWLPYIVISRVVFIYHFYVNVPFLCLGSALIINKYWSNKWAKILTIVYFALVVALFVLFYPVISGVPTSPSTIDSLKWFKSWVF